jgi:3-phenylpropionate/trans-cinnamate dioxygenase ferredoxin subunit
MSWHDVGSAQEVPRGGRRRVECAGRTLCIARDAVGDVYALDDACTHEGYSLSEQGEVDGDEIECLIHGSMFNLKTGAVTGPPATESTRSYAVVVTPEPEGRILVDVDDQAPE